MIQLFNVSKIFNAGRPNEFRALQNIELSIEMNQIIVFKGPSGSGKTTLLSLIGCMSRPTSGRIKLNGSEITSLPERFLSEIRRKLFGFTFQNFNLIRGLTSLENVMIPAYPLGISHKVITQKALSLLNKMNLAAKSHQQIEYLSGGEQQRVAIARALINDPEVVIADEPTAHLDAEFSKQLMAILADLNNEGKTILIASHDPLVYGYDAVHKIVQLRHGVITDPQM